jgi:hypothetical protein
VEIQFLELSYETIIEVIADMKNIRRYSKTELLELSQNLQKGYSCSKSISMIDREIMEPVARLSSVVINKEVIEQHNRKICEMTQQQKRCFTEGLDSVARL